MGIGPSEFTCSSTVTLLVSDHPQQSHHAIRMIGTSTLPYSDFLRFAVLLLRYAGVRVMRYDVREIVRGDSPQALRVVGLRLSDGSEITSETAIAMIKHHHARFCEWTGDRWREIGIVNRKMIVPELDV